MWLVELDQDDTMVSIALPYAVAESDDNVTFWKGEVSGKMVISAELVAEAVVVIGPDVMKADVELRAFGTGDTEVVHDLEDIIEVEPSEWVTCEVRVADAVLMEETIELMMLVIVKFREGSKLDNPVNTAVIDNGIWVVSNEELDLEGEAVVGEV